MWPWVLAAVVTSTATMTSSVADTVDDGPGAARTEVTPPSEALELPAPPKPEARRVEAKRSEAEALHAGRVRTREVLARIVSQPNGFNADRAFGVELAVALWFTERIGVEARVAYAPLLYERQTGQTAFLPAGSFSKVGYAFVDLRGSVAQGNARLFDRWATTVDAYVLLGAGGVLRDEPFGRPVNFAIHGGLGLALDLFGPGVALSMELTDAYYPSESQIGSGPTAIPIPSGHELRAVGGLAFALDPQVYDVAVVSPPPSQARGVRVGLIASNTVDQSYANGSPGLAFTVTLPVTNRIQAEAFVGGFTSEETLLVPVEGVPAGFEPDAFRLPRDALRFAATLGVQLDVLRADVPSFVGEAPSQFRIYGIAGAGVGSVVNDDALHFVGAVGAGFELALPVGLIVAADFRDLLYTEGFSLSHLRTGVLVGWRFGG